MKQAPFRRVCYVVFTAHGSSGHDFVPHVLAAHPWRLARRPPAGVLISGSGLRETSDFFARQLAGRGISARQIGPTLVRGVDLTRFVSETSPPPWLAVHVLRSAGKTLIFFVPRPQGLTKQPGPSKQWASIGDRLMAGRQTLDLTIMVRIHVPEPTKA